MKAVSIALLSEKENKSAVVICKDEASASALSSDLKNFISDEEYIDGGFINFDAANPNKIIELILLLLFVVFKRRNYYRK